MASEAAVAEAMSIGLANVAAGACAALLLLIGLAGCGGYESAYERAVYRFEPVYCYRTIADPDCYRLSAPSAERRLVNYYGPSPRRTKPPPPAAIRLDPPPPAEAGVGSAGREAEADAMGERAQMPMSPP